LTSSIQGIEKYNQLLILNITIEKPLLIFHTMKTILNYLSLLFVLTISSCAKDEKAATSSGSDVSITVYGRVLDESGNPLEGVAVRVGSFSTLDRCTGIVCI
jgi:hypothetical protein